MTLRGFYNAVLIELTKEGTSTILIDEFNHFLNKSIIQTVNLTYNAYEINQQKTDDLIALKKTGVKLVKSQDTSPFSNDIYELPSDYFHILNCTVIYTKSDKQECTGQHSKLVKGVRKLTSDQSTFVDQLYYYKPSYDMPYWVELEGNPMKLEIRKGLTKKDNSYEISDIIIDYLKVPDTVIAYDENVTDKDSLSAEEQKNFDLYNVTSSELEDKTISLQFQEYMCIEILNRCVELYLEKHGNQRLQSHIPINQSIASGITQQK